MFDFSSRGGSGPAAARGVRAYVVGDIHGRLDLLNRLLDRIHDQLKRRAARKTLLVFVGDLIDRGPQSAQVIERLRTYRHHGVRPIYILGNHEEVLLRILGGEADLIAKWRSFGGAECLQSYGVDQRQFDEFDDAAALAVVRAAIPPQHVAFLESFVDSCRVGDYLVVHAGIRPGVPVDQQLQTDLRWIRDPFLFNDADHGFVVVHGHTISDAVDERPNRIGIDTGAYRSGVLSALGLEGHRRWIVDTADALNTNERQVDAIACD
jgi:serine/threonine protein phosphatase 1